MIKANDKKLRNDFADCSSSGSNDYYETKGHGINAFDGTLQEYDYCLDRDDISDFHGNEGRKVIAVHDEFKHTVGYAVISWYRMPSGRYEFTGYLA